MSEIEAFWQAFCARHGVEPTARHDAFAFGDTPDLQDELLDLVLHGPKRATAGLLLEHERDRAPLPEVGGYGIVLDGSGRPRCVIRTTWVDMRPFREVDAAFAWDEGEDDRSLDSWREGHRRYFARACQKLGVAFDETTPVVLERFELVWAPGPGQWAAM